MAKIVLTTIGTQGDLHPFIALGLALKRRGFRPVLAVAEDHADKVRAAGLEAVAVLPSFKSIGERMGLERDEAVRRLMNNQRQMLEQVILPAVESSADALDSVVEGAVAIVASMFVLAAPMIAEKHGIPLISVVLQPMALLSPHDPPHTPDFWMMRNAPDTSIGVWWNRAVYAAAHRYLHYAHSRQLDSVRARHRLAPMREKRMLDPRREAALTLCCYSSQFAPLPPDADTSVRIVGFPVFDSETGAKQALDPTLQAFLDAGPPPIIFTLGTFVVHGSGSFYAEAAEAARRLGQRAVLLTGESGPPSEADGIFRCGYAPHSLLFPRAAVIVHHGGIGTTGQALRSGKPQLVVPHMGDQNDHAHRVVRLGVGLALKPSRFDAERATSRLGRLLSEDRFAAAAQRIGLRLSTENAAATAAAEIEASLAEHLDTKDYRHSRAPVPSRAVA